MSVNLRLERWARADEVTRSDSAQQGALARGAILLRAVQAVVAAGALWWGGLAVLGVPGGARWSVLALAIGLGALAALNVAFWTRPAFSPRLRSRMGAWTAVAAALLVGVFADTWLDWALRGRFIAHMPYEIHHFGASPFELHFASVFMLVYLPALAMIGWGLVMRAGLADALGDGALRARPHQLLRSPDSLEASLLLGWERRTSTPVKIAWRDRQRHLYCVGPTGAGKTSRILNPYASQDIARGVSVLALEPKGSWIGQLAETAHRYGRPTVMIDPVYEGTPSWNILAGRTEEAAEVLISALEATQTGRQIADFWNLEQARVVQNIMRVLKFEKGDNLWLWDVYEALGNDELLYSHVERLARSLGIPLTPPQFVSGSLQKAGVYAPAPPGKRIELPPQDVFGWAEQQQYEWRRLADTVRWFMSDYFNKGNSDTKRNVQGLRARLDRWMANDHFARVFRPRPGVGVVDSLVINSQPGIVFGVAARDAELGDMARVLGVITMTVWDQTLRSRRPSSFADHTVQNPPTALYIDEFHKYANRRTPEMLALIRDYGVSVLIANQSLQAMVGDFGVPYRDQILSNCLTTILFGSLGPSDIQFYQRYLGEQSVEIEATRVSQHVEGFGALPQSATLADSTQIRDQPTYTWADLATGLREGEVVLRTLQAGQAVPAFRARVDFGAPDSFCPPPGHHPTQAAPDSPRPDSRVRLPDLSHLVPEKTEGSAPQTQEPDQASPIPVEHFQTGATVGGPDPKASQTPDGYTYVGSSAPPATFLIYLSPKGTWAFLHHPSGIRNDDLTPIALTQYGFPYERMRAIRDDIIAARRIAAGSHEEPSKAVSTSPTPEAGSAQPAVVRLNPDASAHSEPVGPASAEHDAIPETQHDEELLGPDMNVAQAAPAGPPAPAPDIEVAAPPATVQPEPAPAPAPAQPELSAAPEQAAPADDDVLIVVDEDPVLDVTASPKPPATPEAAPRRRIFHRPPPEPPAAS